MIARQRGGAEVEIFAMMVAFLAVIAVVVTLIEMYQCGARWKDSGMKSEYRLGAGCMVQRPDGRWLPASAIREVGN